MGKENNSNAMITRTLFKKVAAAPRGYLPSDLINGVTDTTDA